MGLPKYLPRHVRPDRLKENTASARQQTVEYLIT